MRKDSGFTLIEVLGSVVAAAFLMASLMQLWNLYYGNLQQGQAASHIHMVGEAVKRYISAHYQQLLNSSSQTTGAQISTAQLRNEGFLPEGFQQNVWNQDYEIYIRRTPANAVTAVILTTGGREHEAGDSFGTVLVPGAALRVEGGGGGFVPAPVHGSDDTLIAGAGGYILNLASMGISSPGAGHLGLYLAFDADDSGTDYLYRGEVPGHPELNQMTTELDMTNHTIERVRSIQYVSRTVTADQTCSSADEGQMFLDRVQGMYLCRNNRLVLMSDTGNSSFLKNATIATHGTKINKPDCGASTGKTPQIFVGPVMFSSGASSPSMAAVQAYATSISNTQWQVNLRVLNTSGNWITPGEGFGQTMVFAVCN